MIFKMQRFFAISFGIRERDVSADMFSTMNYRERVKRAQECLDRVNLIEAQQGR